MLEWKKAGPEDRELLWNIHQKYLYEMTNFYDDEMDAAGNYHYGYFDAYFTEPQRTALLLYCDGRLAGFALLNPYSYIGGHPDHVMAEFTVFPIFRKKGVAARAAAMILRHYGGNWEIKYNEKNLPAKGLWTKLTAPCHPQAIRYSDTETVLVFSADGYPGANE